MAKTNIASNHIPTDLAGTDPKFYVELFRQGSMLRALLDKLLVDHTTGKNIVWGTDSYLDLGEDFAPEKQMTKDQCLQLIRDEILIPRVQKSKQDQKDRTKKKAEVFTPTWIVNYMVNAVDNMWFDREDVFNVEDNDTHTWVSVKEKIVFPDTQGHTWKDYVIDKRLEITCGEAPYLVSRYDVTTGEPIPVSERVGVLDRKLCVVSENTESESDWLVWARKAFQATHGFEWQGDNLLFARINLLLTFIDYYRDKFSSDPSLAETRKIARVIAWNVWQMDGLKDIPPYGIPEDAKEEKSTMAAGGDEIIDQMSITDYPEMIPDGDAKKAVAEVKEKAPSTIKVGADGLYNENGIPYCVLRDWRRHVDYTFHGLKRTDDEKPPAKKKAKKKAFEELTGTPALKNPDLNPVETAVLKEGEAETEETSAAEIFATEVSETNDTVFSSTPTSDKSGTDIYDGFLNLDRIGEESLKEETPKEKCETKENSGEKEENEEMPILGGSNLEILPILGCSNDLEEKREEKDEEKSEEEKNEKDISAIFEDTEVKEETGEEKDNSEADKKNEDVVIADIVSSDDMAESEENSEILTKTTKEISDIFLSVGTLFSHVYTDRNAAAKDAEDSYPVSVWSKKGFWLYEGMSNECPEDVKKMEAVRMYIDWEIKKVAITAKG